MLDPIEESKFEALRRNCRELKMPPPPELFLDLEVRESGLVTFKDHFRAHSWTRNYYNWMLGLMAEVPAIGETTFVAGARTSKTIAGVVGGTNTQACGRGTNVFLASGFSDSSVNGTFGVRVGTGDTAFTVNDFALATPVAPGSAAGQLIYDAMTYPTTTYAAKVWTNNVWRRFNNNSGGTITIAEVGLYSTCYAWANAAIYMMERSVLASTVALVNGAQLTVTYTIQMDFSAID